MNIINSQRKNRNTDKMIERVRRQTNDLANTSNVNDDVIYQYLCEAQEKLQHYLVQDNKGYRCLLAIEKDIAVSVDTGEFEIPEDAIIIRNVFYGKLNKEKNKLTYQENITDEDFSFDNQIRYTDARNGNNIKIVPAPATSANYVDVEYCKGWKIPLQCPDSENEAFQDEYNEITKYIEKDIVLYKGEYYQSLINDNADVNPLEDYENSINKEYLLANPEYSQSWGKIVTRIENVIGLDTAIEYYATSLIGYEELEDDKPIGAFGQLFTQQISMLVNSKVGGVLHKRRFVKII